MTQFGTVDLVVKSFSSNGSIITAAYLNRIIIKTCCLIFPYIYKKVTGFYLVIVIPLKMSRTDNT